MKLLWPWLMALLLVGPARAGELHVLALHLQPDATWQRGTPEEERQDDVVTLSRTVQDGTGLQVMVPRHPPLLHADADTFYRNLRRKWAAQFGNQASIAWMDLAPQGAGIRWLSCRHPTRSGDGVVFHLASVHAGRAYSLLLFAPAGTEALPQAARALLATAAFAPTSPTWCNTQDLLLLPQGEALRALGEAEADGLGSQGMLTGYGLRGERDGGEAVGAPAGEMRLHWFLDGFRWTGRSGRDDRIVFQERGQLSACTAVGAVKVELQVAAAELPLTARVSLHSYCGPQAPWAAALAALRQGDRTPLERLARAHACTVQADDADLARLVAGAGQTAVRTLPLPLPALSAAPGNASVYWAEVGLMPRPAGTVGNVLLTRPGLYLVYAPAAQTLGQSSGECDSGR